MIRPIHAVLSLVLGSGCTGNRAVIESGEYVCESDDDCAWGWQCVPQGERKVCVTLPDQLSITPGEVDIGAGRFVQLTANAAVTWSVDDGGSIDAEGGYRAPLEPGTYAAIATSVADRSRSVRATIRVRPLELAVVAGQLGGHGNIDGVGADARFGARAIAADSSGALWISDLCTLRRLDPVTAEVTTLIGQHGQCGTLDGIGAAARVGGGSLTYSAASGKLYLADPGGYLLQEIDPVSLEVRRVPNLLAFFSMTQPAVSNDGYLYYGDNWAIRRERLDRYEPTVIAGTLGERGEVDGTGTAARFSYIRGVVLDRQGNLLVVTEGRLRKLDLTTFEVTTLPSALEAQWRVTVDSAGQIYALDGVGLLTRLNPDGSGGGPAGRTFTGFGGCNSLTARGLDVYAACSSTIRRLSGLDTATIAGLDPSPGFADGTASAARFYRPQAIAVRGSEAFVADSGNGLIRHIDLATGEVRTVRRTTGGAPEPLTFQDPSGVAVDGDVLYVSDAAASTVYRVSLDDGRTEVLVRGFYRPGQLVYDGNGHLYVADDGNGKIRRVDVATGGFVTVAEDDLIREYTDEYDHRTKHFPLSFAIDGDCALYVASATDGTIERIDPATGERSLLARIRRDEDLAEREWTFARQPWALASDGHGYLYTAAPGVNGLFRVSTATGAVERIAGIDGEQGVKLGPLPARLSDPVALAVTASGDLLVVDTSEHVVLSVRQGR